MSQSDPETSTWARYALVGVLVWAALCVAWSTRPLVDTVPTGRVNDEQTSQEVECHSALSASDGPAERLPTLEPPRLYEREPCRVAHRQARLMLGVDVVVALAASAALGRKLTADRARRDEQGRPLVPSA